MSGLIAASGGSAWTYGGAILTFVFPMVLFIAVAGALYILYTKPHMTPGHYYRPGSRPGAAAGPPGAQGRPRGATPADAPPEEAGDR